MTESKDITAFSMRQSEAWDSWCQCFDLKALLRSRGHRFKDGRWDEDETGFHVYRDIEFPAFGANRTFRCHPSYLKLGAGDPFGFELVDCNWKPAISRSAESLLFDPSVYINLPPIDIPMYEDYVLNLNAQGTDFIQRNRPGNPLAHTFQYLVELRELPQVPHFLRASKKRVSDLGGEYLNVEFGWKPLIKDLKKIHDLQFKIAHQLLKLTRDNGLSIRRRSKKVVTEDSTVVCEGSLGVPFGDLGDTSIGGNESLHGYALCGPFGGNGTYPNWAGQADYRLSRISRQTAWSCCTFKYFVPDIGSNLWTNKAISVLYGANPTPSAIYSVYPWTWLLDWFTNVGDIVSNLSRNAVENESFTNAYAMYTEEVYDVVDVSLHWDSIDASSLPGSCFILDQGADSMKHTHYKGSKLRRQASPFGFGLKRGDFTASQLAILAALAVSRIDTIRSWLKSAHKDVKLLSR